MTSANASVHSASACPRRPGASSGAARAGARSGRWRPSTAARRRALPARSGTRAGRRPRPAARRRGRGRRPPRRRRAGRPQPLGRRAAGGRRGGATSTSPGPSPTKASGTAASGADSRRPTRGRPAATPGQRCEDQRGGLAEFQIAGTAERGGGAGAGERGAPGEQAEQRPPAAASRRPGRPGTRSAARYRDGDQAGGAARSQQAAAARHPHLGGRFHDLFLRSSGRSAAISLSRNSSAVGPARGILVERPAIALASGWGRSGRDCASGGAPLPSRSSRSESDLVRKG